MAYLIFAFRVALGALLAIAGILKAHDGVVATTTSIAAYRILPAAAVAPLGAALPYLEIFLGGYLVLGLFTRIAASVAAIQFVIFAAAVASLLVRHISADCGCFGSGVATPPSWTHVAGDVALGLVALAIAARGPGAFALDRRLGMGGTVTLGHESP
jgi:uncharacterized membrane protein YphA (DoxX/SURF4 family)